MELLDKLTLLCAVLGLILLLLAIVVVVLYIVDQCRTARGRQQRMTTSANGLYIPVANDDCEKAINADTIDTVGSYRASLSGGSSSKTSRWEAPVKKKLRWKLLVARRQLEPTAAKLISDTKEKRGRSKSEWDLPTGETDFLLLKERRRQGGEEDEVDKSLGDDFQSQYFDAMETIGEEEEADHLTPTNNNDNDNDEAEWTDDIDATEEGIEGKALSTNGQHHRRRRARRRRRDHPPLTLTKSESLTRRIKALKKLDATTMNALEQTYLREYARLQSRFEAKRRDLMERRAQFIADNDIKAFWSLAMQQCGVLGVIIQEWDKPVLDALRDMRVKQGDEWFSLEFHFEENDYFTNRVLTKTYTREKEGNEWKCEGCHLMWNSKEKNVTLRPVMKRKKESGEKVRKWAKRNSFFNFFQVPQHDNPADDLEIKQLIKAHGEIGVFLRDNFIPRAIAFFMGMEQRQRRRRKTSRQHQRNRTKTKTKEHNVVKEKEDDDDVPTGVEQQEKEIEVVESKEEASEQRNGSLVEVEMRLDGRYVLTDSHNFDAFLKALDVGLVRRKLAAAQRSINVIETGKEGKKEYVIRTETPVRTTQIEFNLNEPFDELTLDGRQCVTTPTRHGNVLTLTQKDTKGSKDSEMVRTFGSDGSMLLEMSVGDIKCQRIYNREDIT